MVTEDAGVLGCGAVLCVRSTQLPVFGEIIVLQLQRSSGEVAIKMILQNVSNLSPNSTVSHLQRHLHENLKICLLFFQNVYYQVGYDSSLMNVHWDLNM
jgi:hypothetical protein